MAASALSSGHSSLFPNVNASAGGGGVLLFFCCFGGLVVFIGSVDWLDVIWGSEEEGGVECRRFMSIDVIFEDFI